MQTVGRFNCLTCTFFSKSWSRGNWAGKKILWSRKEDRADMNLDSRDFSLLFSFPHSLGDLVFYKCFLPCYIFSSHYTFAYLGCPQFSALLISMFVCLILEPRSPHLSVRRNLRRVWKISRQTILLLIDSSRYGSWKLLGHLVYTLPFKAFTPIPEAVLWCCRFFIWDMKLLNIIHWPHIDIKALEKRL